MTVKSEVHTDVLVLGSGPSGFAAPVNASENNISPNDVTAESIRDIIGI